MPTDSLRRKSAAIMTAFLIGAAPLTLWPGSAAQAASVSTTTISTPGNPANDPQVVVAPNGTATAVWWQNDGTYNRIQTATKPLGGSWGSPTMISPATENATGPRLAVAPSGAVTAIWSSYDGAYDRIYVSTRAAGGSWTTPTPLSDPSHDAADPQIATASDSSTTVVWRLNTGLYTRVETTTRTAGGTWSPAVILSSAGHDASYPDVAASANGTSSVVWREHDGSDFIIKASIRHGNGAWGMAESLSFSGASGSTPDVVVAPDGTTTVVWRRSDGSNLRIQTNSRPLNGSWTGTTFISDPGRDAWQPQLAVAPTGTAYAIWRRDDGLVYRAQVSARQANGVWSAPSTLSTGPENAMDPDIAITPDGTAIAVWTQSDGAFTWIQSATKAPSGNWGPATNLSPTDQRSELADGAVGLDGTLAVVWRQSSGPPSQATAYVAEGLYKLIPETGAITGNRKVTKRSRTFTFTSPDPGVSFQCRVDATKRRYKVRKKIRKQAVAWQPCASPYLVKVGKLKLGRHNLQVRAVFNGVADPTPTVKVIRYKRK